MPATVGTTVLNDADADEPHVLDVIGYAPNTVYLRRDIACPKGAALLYVGEVIMRRRSRSATASTIAS
jgi:hypothetical protein